MLIKVKVKMEEIDQYNLNAGNISFFICCPAGVYPEVFRCSSIKVLIFKNHQKVICLFLL